jgi:hypothetical protein
VADHGRRHARIARDRLGDRGDVLELTVDGVGFDIPGRATSAPVDRVDREPAGEQWPHDSERRVVSAGAVHEDQR